MELSSREDRGHTVLKVDGRLDALSTSEFDECWQRLVGEGARRVVVDMTDLTYVSSAGLGSVVALAKQLQDLGGSVAVAGLSGVVKEVFAISMLDRVIPLADSVDEAVEKI